MTSNAKLAEKHAKMWSKAIWQTPEQQNITAQEWKNFVLSKDEWR